MLVLSVTANSQDKSVRNQENNVLYAGYNNKVSFPEIKKKYGRFKIESINCTVSQPKEAATEDEFLVKPDRAAISGNAKIYFVVAGKRVDSVLYSIRVLPQLKLYWGSNAEGSECSDSDILRVNFVTRVTFDARFEIINWEAEILGRKFKGEGNKLSPQFLKLTKSLPAGGKVYIKVNYKNSEGLVFSKNGAWVKG